MNWLLIAGGAFLGTMVPPKEPNLSNHVLRGDKVPAKEVACRNIWGTPMMPDGVSYKDPSDPTKTAEITVGKAGYRVNAPVNPELIAWSLFQPPRTNAPIFRPQDILLQAPKNISAAK